MCRQARNAKKIYGACPIVVSSKADLFRPSATFLLALAGSVLAMSAVGAVILIATQPTSHLDCPDPKPAAQITVDDAIQVMRASYEPEQQSSWLFYLHRAVKYCHLTSSWWTKPSQSINQTTWERMNVNMVPQTVKEYAGQTETDLVFHVIRASFCCGALSLDEAWVDAVSSQLVLKWRVAS